jgi:hypothetical protein
MSPPPWTKTITGFLSLPEAVPVVHTFAVRQFSDMAVPSGTISASGCMHIAPDVVASRTPGHVCAACGGRKRRSPVGGAA